MPYLQLNGYTVKVVAGGDVSFEETMQRRGYSPNAKYQFSRQGLSRAWRFTTPPLARDEALALVGQLNALGDSWRWDLTGSPNGVSTAVADFYSDKRRAPTAAGDEATVVSAYAADGLRVYDWEGNPVGVFPGCEGSLSVDPGTTNKVSVDVADSDDETQFTAVGGATKFDETTYRWTGTGSVKVVSGGAGQGIKVLTGSLTGSQRYECTVHVFRGGGDALKLVIDDGFDPPQEETYTSAGVTGWERLRITKTIHASSTSIDLSVLTSSGSGTFYVDGWQIEQQAEAPTAWVAGGTTKANGLIEFDPSPLTTAAWNNGFTFYAWAYPHSPVSGADYIFRTATTDPGLTLYLNSSEQFGTNLSHNWGSSLSVTGTTIGTAYQWYLLTVVFDPTTSATGTLSLYQDGALVGSDTSWSGHNSLPDFDGAGADLRIGTFSSSSGHFVGLIGPCGMLPYVVPAAVISDWYGTGANSFTLPPGLMPMSAQGDFLGIGEAAVSVYAQVNRINNTPVQIGSSWDSGAYVVDFTLHEASGK